jgi:predicted dehydrogenase
MLGIGLIGAGLHGSRYAQHLARGDVAGTRLIALTRRDRALGERTAREHGCRYSASVAELVLDPGVDAVIVATPAAAHAASVLAAVRARKPVLVEKPLTHSLDEARALLREVREGDGRVVVAQTLRWEAVYERAAALAAEVGPVRAAQALFLKGDFMSRSTSDSGATDFHRAIFACGIHHLDWAGALFPGGFARAFAVESPAEEGLSFTALLEARAGGTFTLTVRLRGAGTQDAFRVVGDRGALEGDRPAHVLARLDAGGRTNVDLGPRVMTLPRVVAAFRDHVLGLVPNPVPLEDGVRAVARAEACALSLACKAPVPVFEEIP